MLCVVPFDKQEVFQEEILPRLKELDALCTAEQIPFFFAAAVADSGEETTYKSMSRTSIPMGKLLSEDKIVDFEKVLAGFETFLPGTIPELVLSADDDVIVVEDAIKASEDEV